MNFQMFKLFLEKAEEPEIKLKHHWIIKKAREFQKNICLGLLLLLLLLLSRFSRVQLCSTHRWQPTRLPRPWDSPGNNTGVGCHFLLQCMKVKSEREVAQSCPTLATPWTAAHQAPLSMGFPRQESWSRLLFALPGDLPHPGTELTFPTPAG